MEKGKKVEIGNDVWLGHNVVVMGNVTIGDGAVIGSSAVVTKDIPPFAIAVGNPARVIKYRFDEKTIEALKNIAWWDWDYEQIKLAIDDFKDIKFL
ncbi:CatB-related O-acetyltransferase [Halarcobacter anaerophilus]|uniref:CatB-related O-acetyltransferase n=1 Tax=Halarcobacter anaerophilus TaxID=877500 RepID=UPI000A6B3B4D|nr:CatB-related O-acetyltransferase [Halarcobacter anaerophilus]